MLMNSFSTSADTLEFLQKSYPVLAGETGLEMMQNKVPKIDATPLEVRYIFVVVIFAVFFVMKGIDTVVSFNVLSFVILTGQRRDSHLCFPFPQ